MNNKKDNSEIVRLKEQEFNTVDGVLNNKIDNVDEPILNPLTEEKSIHDPVLNYKESNKDLDQVVESNLLRDPYKENPVNKDEKVSTEELLLDDKKFEENLTQTRDKLKMDDSQHLIESEDEDLRKKKADTYADEKEAIERKDLVEGRSELIDRDIFDREIDRR